MLDGLMGRAVLADADGVVREDVGDLLLHHCGKAHAVLHIVGEAEERGRIGAQAAVQRHGVADRAHRVLADAEVNVVAFGRFSGEIAAVLHVGLVGRAQVGAAAEQVRQMRGQTVKRLAGGVAGGVAAFERPERIVMQQVAG